MTQREKYVPGPATGGRVNKEGDTWSLVLVRELRHAPELVWNALTDPAQLAQWAPFDADRNLGAVGAVTLATLGAPRATAECVVRRAEKPKLLEYNWGGNDLRWELEATDAGTRLTLWAVIPKRFIAWGAAGWHICFEVLEHLLAGDAIGRITGPEAFKYDWPRLTAEYAHQLGVELPVMKENSK
jgi:uncharacterized protein YndB with AHSA1/START domain